MKISVKIGKNGNYHDQGVKDMVNNYSGIVVSQSGDYLTIDTLGDKNKTSAIMSSLASQKKN